MKINAIKISNILSFQQFDNIDDAPNIKFNDGLNIIIGPNGAGKSNFLEIINQIFNNVLFSSFIFNEQIIQQHKINNEVQLQTTLQIQNLNRDLSSNNKSNSNVKQVKIIVGLNDNDKENLKFLRTILEQLNILSQTYSNSAFTLPNVVTDEDIDNINEIELLIENLNKTSFSISTSFSNPVEIFVSIYLRMFNLIQYLIIINNKERKTNWVPLKNTFAIISGYRNYNQIQSNQLVQNESSDLQQIKQKMIQETTTSSSNDEPVVFSYVRHKLVYNYHRLRVKIGTPDAIDPIDKFENPIFHSLNKILQLTLRIKLHLLRPDDNSLNYEMKFIDTNTNQSVNVAELSAGEKGIIHFIFSVHGYDLENGVMIIDEPEIHLHPQIQEKYLDILNEAIIDMKMQFIIATHSPILVNSKTIDSVKRFYKNKNDFTEIITSTKTPKHHNLIKYLDYTKATQVMFSDHAILVEGESDAYAYQHYYENYKERKKITKNLNFIHIVGVGAYDQWKKFFKDWKISTFFIRDLDNFSGGVDGIEKKYTENIFILKKGDLEDYIDSVKSEKFHNAVDFCENRYQNWFNDLNNVDKIEELDDIFKIINSKLS